MHASIGLGVCVCVDRIWNPEKGRVGSVPRCFSFRVILRSRLDWVVTATLKCLQCWWRSVSFCCSKLVVVSLLPHV